MDMPEHKILSLENRITELEAEVKEAESDRDEFYNSYNDAVGKLVGMEKERDEAIDKKASALHAFDLCVQERDALQAENERLNKEMNESYAGQRFFNAGMERAAEIEVAKPDVGVAIGAAEWLAGFRCGVRAKADAIRKEIK